MGTGGMTKNPLAKINGHVPLLNTALLALMGLLLWNGRRVVADVDALEKRTNEHTTLIAVAVETLSTITDRLEHLEHLEHERSTP